MEENPAFLAVYAVAFVLEAPAAEDNLAVYARKGNCISSFFRF